MPNYYVINLQSSVERWREISVIAAELGISIDRIDAVNGQKIEQTAWHQFDVQAFQNRNGRKPKPGEFGCYASHVAALEEFINSGATSAVILEDDAPINREMRRVAEHLDQCLATREAIVKLCSHRTEAFRIWKQLDSSYDIGRVWFGPSGSAAAYYISRTAAIALLSKLVPGSLPFDIMLERSWAHGVPVLHINPPVVKKPRPPHSTINTVSAKNAAFRKFPIYLRWPAYLFRTKELFWRWAYLLRTQRNYR